MRHQGIHRGSMMIPALDNGRRTLDRFLEALKCLKPEPI
ncbi:hypothetical protein T12_9530 [Trichinella patagoniensis]|uniref:Uncharacterized protein n=1 Tax=Trichinella patagoniensis TaxID=990121 RepID=A0A0V0Z0E9_9BILA|nr:hypothetical protein T12_9530 [Trichinella patagoniensis]